MTTDNFHFNLQNRLILIGQTGGQLYSDTSPFSVPWLNIQELGKCNIDLFVFCHFESEISDIQ